VSDQDRKQYGYLPYMATGSRGSLGALLASSFCERVNSAANLVLTDGNTCLDEDDIHMLVCLRMNRSFMEFMRERFQKESGQDLNVSVLTEGENKNTEIAMLDTSEDDDDDEAEQI
jgi:hypothetical protein